MQKNILCSVVFVLILISFHLYGQEISDNELYLYSSIPKENEDFTFSRAFDIEFDENDNYYILDYGQNLIFKFNNLDKYIYKIGRSGKGPGEFMGVNILSCYNNKICLFDVKNSKIQFFSNEGEYISSFIHLFITHDLAYYKGNIYANLRYDQDQNNPYVGSSLITVFNEQGKIINGFGKFPFSDEYSTTLSKSTFKVYNNELYVLFRYYPILRKYSFGGQLLEEYQLNKVNYESKIQKNYYFDNLKKNQSTYDLVFLFFAFDVNEDGIFLALYSEDLIIDHYDFNGNFIQRFKIKHSSDYDIYVYAIRVKKIGNNSYKFYVVKSEEYSTLDIYLNKNVRN
jgi:hypothetical protein